ncbi:unnamed protein product, partial [Ascophyllum nodosum]
KNNQAFRYPVTLDMEPFLNGQAWAGSAYESQVSELAGDPDHPGTIRNRQKWIPQAWREAEQRAGEILQSNPLSSSYERTSSMFEDEVPRSPSIAGTYKGEAGKGQQRLFYDLQAVVVHRGTTTPPSGTASRRDAGYRSRASGLPPATRAEEAWVRKLAG